MYSPNRPSRQGAISSSDRSRFTGALAVTARVHRPGHQGIGPRPGAMRATDLSQRNAQSGDTLPRPNDTAAVIASSELGHWLHPQLGARQSRPFGCSPALDGHLHIASATLCEPTPEPVPDETKVSLNLCIGRIRDPSRPVAWMSLLQEIGISRDRPTARMPLLQVVNTSRDAFRSSQVLTFRGHSQRRGALEARHAQWPDDGSALGTTPA